MTDKMKRKTVRLSRGSLYFLSQARAYLMERKKNENGYTKIEAAVKMIIEAVGEDVLTVRADGKHLSCSLYVPRDFFRSLAKLLWRNICQNPLRLPAIIW